MKVIFLDIDGVLNLRNRTRDKYGSVFHKKWVDNLKTIIDATGAQIVISSTWRLEGLQKMQDMWKFRKLPGKVIDVTQHFWAKDVTIPRGVEIEHWMKLSGNFQRINWSKEEQINYLGQALVKNYIILDDDSDMLYNQREHFVKTSNQWNEKDAIEGYGLTKTAAEKSIQILNSSIINLYYP